MALGLVATAFGLGLSLGLLPGPVQFLLLSETGRGGLRRGFQAMLGANGTMALLLVCLALGVSALAPAGEALRILRVAGGLFLLFLAGDAMRSALRPAAGSNTAIAASTPPLVRGSLAVVLNPGAWVFLATTASALLATAARSVGRGPSLFVALAMIAGVAAVDGPVVLLGEGARRLERRAGRIVTPVLAVGLAAFGLLLLISGLRG